MAERPRRWPTACDLVAAPWRLFFVLVALHAAVAPVLVLWGGQAPALHGAGMVLGLGLGAVAGYALTALPGWDGGPPVRAGVTAGLGVVWLAGQAGVAAGAPWLAAGLPLGLAMLMLRRRRGRARRVMVAGAAPAIAAVTLADGAGSGLVMLAALIAVVGGRAVPAFLFSAAGQDTRMGWGMPAAIAALTLAALVQPLMAGAAGALALWHMRRWPGRAVLTGAGALLAGAWVALAGALFRRAAGGGSAPAHLIGMGAMGLMIVAISSRAGMRRPNGVPRAGRAALAAGVLVAVAAALRVGGGGEARWLSLPALIWAAGWGAYLWALAPALAGPVPRPAFSGRPARNDASRDMATACRGAAFGHHGCRGGSVIRANPGRDGGATDARRSSCRATPRSSNI